MLPLFIVAESSLSVASSESLSSEVFFSSFVRLLSRRLLVSPKSLSLSLSLFVSSCREVSLVFGCLSSWVLKSHIFVYEFPLWKLGTF